MNILTIGLHDNVSEVFNKLVFDTCNNIIQVFDKENALQLLRNNNNIWDWIIIQGHDDPEHWKSILCAVNAHARSTPITVLSSHIDGTKLKTPVCSMHRNKQNNQMVVSRCAMQNLLQEEDRPEPRIHRPQNNHNQLDILAPIVFEYHAPCR